MGRVIKYPASEIKKVIKKDGYVVIINVYGDGEGGWLLEIEDEHWNSTCWEESFKSSQDALEAGIKAIDEDGIKSFIGKPV